MGEIEREENVIIHSIDRRLACILFILRNVFEIQTLCMRIFRILKRIWKEFLKNFLKFLGGPRDNCTAIDG